MTRSIIILSTIWIGLCLAVFLNFALPEGVFPLDECSSLPKDQLANCRHQQENGFPQPLRNHPNLKGYPDKMLDKDGNWRPSLDDALSGPQRIHLPYISMSVGLREGERAFANENAKWMSGKIDTRCMSCAPEAVVFSTTSGQQVIVNSYSYIESWPNSRYPDSNEQIFKINIPEDLNSELDDLRERLEFKNSLNSHADWGDPNRMRRHVIKFVEEPKSIAKETGIPRIMTYSYRVNWFNRQTNELEITATTTEILFPYKNGTAHLSALITTLDGSAPTPVPWQHLWRDIHFDDGLPDNRPKDGPDDSGEDTISIGYYLAGVKHCQIIDVLPDDWAWPKGYPRHWWSLENLIP